jgi:hypothetical protein
LILSLTDEKKNTIPAEFGIVDVCLATGWDYWTYVSQPNWFVKYLELYLQVKRDVEVQKTPRK